MSLVVQEQKKALTPSSGRRFDPVAKKSGTSTDLDELVGCVIITPNSHSRNRKKKRKDSEVTPQDINGSKDDPMDGDVSLAEKWLTHGKPLDKAYLRTAVAAMQNESKSPLQETRSSLSSPGKVSMREKLRRRLLKEHRDRYPQRYPSEHAKENEEERNPKRDTSELIKEDRERNYASEIEKARSNPPPPPISPPPVKTSSPTSQSHFDHDNSLVEEPSTTSESRFDHDNSVVEEPSTTSQSRFDLPDNTLVQERTSRPSARAVQSASRRGMAEMDLYEEKPTKQESAFVRVSRQVRSRPPPRRNRVLLHIYDLIHDETVMLLPFGLTFPLGQCFSACNSGLHALGTGAYHCGVEVNNIEYAYGSSPVEGTSGVFTCIPKHSPGYQYRTTLDFGARSVRRCSWVEPKGSESGYEEDSFLDGGEIMKKMASQYLGVHYDLLRKNCCTFARDACLRLGVKEEEIPTWFMNLADAGAATQDVAKMSIIPITTMLSMMEEEEVGSSEYQEECETGFEVIAKRSDACVDRTKMDVVKVLGSVDLEKHQDDDIDVSLALRRTLSWQY